MSAPRFANPSFRSGQAAIVVLAATTAVTAILGEKPGPVLESPASKQAAQYDA